MNEQWTDANLTELDEHKDTHFGQMLSMYYLPDKSISSKQALEVPRDASKKFLLDIYSKSSKTPKTTSGILKRDVKSRDPTHQTHQSIVITEDKELVEAGEEIHPLEESMRQHQRAPSVRTISAKDNQSVSVKRTDKFNTLNPASRCEESNPLKISKSSTVVQISASCKKPLDFGTKSQLVS